MTPLVVARPAQQVEAHLHAQRYAPTVMIFPAEADPDAECCLERPFLGNSSVFFLIERSR